MASCMFLESSSDTGNERCIQDQWLRNLLFLSIRELFLLEEIVKAHTYIDNADGRTSDIACMHVHM